jgi:hypothetical protein
VRKQINCFLAIAGTKVNPCGVLGKLRMNVVRLLRENLQLGSGWVVFRQQGNCVKQDRTHLIVKVLGGQGGLRAKQALAQFLNIGIFVFFVSVKKQGLFELHQSLFECVGLTV